MTVGVGRTGQGVGQSLVCLRRCYAQPRGGGETFPVPSPLRGGLGWGVKKFLNVSWHSHLSPKPGLRPDRRPRPTHRQAGQKQTENRRRLRHPQIHRSKRINGHGDRVLRLAVQRLWGLESFTNERRDSVMNGNKISFTIEGPDENRGHLELSVFAEKVRHFLDLLNVSVKDRGDESVVFHVVRLSHSSPATIECQPRAEGRESAAAAVHAVGESLRQVEEKKTQNLSHPVLSSMEQLVKFNPTKIVRAELHILGSEVEDKRIYKLDDTFKERLSHARRMEERVISTIDGRLEQINIHNNANTFRIYTALPILSSLNCVFQGNLLERMQNSLGSFVSVSGECFYRPESPFPYKIHVRNMVVLPSTEELPSLSDLYGIAPSGEREQLSERLVRELRNGWGRDKQ